MRSFIFNCFSAALSFVLLFVAGALCAFIYLAFLGGELRREVSAENFDDFFFSSPKGSLLRIENPSGALAGTFLRIAEKNSENSFSVPVPPQVSPDGDGFLRVSVPAFVNFFGAGKTFEFWALVKPEKRGKWTFRVVSAGIGKAKFPGLFDGIFVESFAEEYSDSLPGLSEFWEKLAKVESIDVKDGAVIFVK